MALLMHQFDVVRLLPDRLFSLMSSHKLEFGKLAVYVVADYVTAVQKVTLLPALKVEWNSVTTSTPI